MKTILIPFFALLLSINSLAQKPDKEKIKALKVAHITEQLDLTAKEAQAFWPVYNANQEVHYKLRHNKVRNRLEELSSPESETKITETEAKELLEKISKIEDDNYQTEKEYYQKLSSILSSTKILKLKFAEYSFRSKMIKEFKSRHKGEKPKK